MSELMQGQIDQLQQDIYDRLSSDEKLAGIPVLYEKTKDIESEIEKALGTLDCGICIIVTPPICAASKPNLPGPYFDSIETTVNILESPVINQGEQGTKKTAAYVAELCAKRLHHYQTRDGRTITVPSITPVADEQYRLYTLKPKTAFGLK